MNDPHKNTLSLIFVTIFIDLIGFGMLIPVVPTLLANPESPFFLLSINTPVEQGYILIGLLTGLYFFGQFISTPILGDLSDKYGRKKIIMLSIIGSMFSFILFAIGIFAKSITLLFIARGLNGFTSGIVSVSQAAITDFTPPHLRSKNFGVIGAAYGIGFIIGPFLGGVLSNPELVSWFAPSTPFLFAAFLAFLNFLSVYYFLPETNLSRTTAPLRWSQSIKNIISAYGMKEIRPLIVTNFFYNAGFAFFTTFLGVFLIVKFGFNQSAIGYYFAFVGVCMAISQTVILPRVVKRFAEAKVFNVAILATALFTLAHLTVSVWWGLLLIVPFFAVANGLANVTITVLVSQSVRKEVQGQILGINTSVNALALMIPSLFGGFVAASISPESPVLFGGLLIFVAWVIFVVFWKGHRTPVN
ncbi:MAG: MFS transporter [Patescibacteria group bacterium]